MYISVVETSAQPLSTLEDGDSVCRLYEVGRKRPDDADSDIDDAHSDSDDDDWDGPEGEVSALS